LHSQSLHLFCFVFVSQLKKPSIRAPGKSIFMQAPPPLLEATKPNLTKALSELVEEGDLLDITDPSLPNVAVNIKIKWAQ
jgi:ubiquitin-activating enzyme E1 C